MKDHRARSMGDTASAVGSMLLFVLFAVCMLMAVAVAADTYSRIKTGYQQSFGTAASIKYISNKLRAAENVTLLEDGSAAAIESAGTVSVIYCGDGGLYEKNTGPRRRAYSRWRGAYFRRLPRWSSASTTGFMKLQ